MPSGLSVRGKDELKFRVVRNVFSWRLEGLI